MFASLAEQQDHREFTFGNSWEFDLLQILAVFPGNFAKNTWKIHILRIFKPRSSVTSFNRIHHFTLTNTHCQFSLLRRVQSDVTELSWHGLVFDKLTKWESRASIGHWLTRMCACIVTSPSPPLDGAYCNALLLACWSVRQNQNRVSSVQLRRSVHTLSHYHHSLLVPLDCHYELGLTYLATCTIGFDFWLSRFFATCDRVSRQCYMLS